MSEGRPRGVENNANKRRRRRDEERQARRAADERRNEATRSAQTQKCTSEMRREHRHQRSQRNQKLQTNANQSSPRLETKENDRRTTLSDEQHNDLRWNCARFGAE